jgi:virginiamycin A acetyltransferase
MSQKYSNIRRKTVIEVGMNVFLPYAAKITVPRCAIGDNTRINGPIIIRGQEECFIGKYGAFGYHITIITTNHDISRPNLQVNMQRSFGFSNLEISKGPVVIGNNVWIGDNVSILSGVNIGDGSVVGAGAVVTDHLPACSVVAGVPAKVVKYRFSKEIIAKYLEIKWWDWPAEKISRNRVFFETDLTQCQPAHLEKIIVE